ncbi:lig1 [Symbiodinium pilosum]|uniref:DNA ligase n=1 Tax=Symbiodinium pilosum TaxID=2952 RepID=A0A812KLU9_SYMPI|nr:lig1 [Symbiodinium pilosum]
MAPRKTMTTPPSKQSQAAAKDADGTPEAPAKRRRLVQSTIQITPTKPVSQAGEIVVADALGKPQRQLAGSLHQGETGPWSLWHSSGAAADKGAKELQSPAFDPKLREDEFPVGKPVSFSLLSGALLEIEELKGSGKGSRKTMTVILSNLFRLLMHVQPQDIIAAIYILINKVAPDYEAAELGVGDSIIIKSLCENFGRSEATIKHSLATGEAKDLGEVALQSRVSQKMLMMPPKLTISKVFSEMKAIAHSAGKDSQKAKKDKIKKLLVASRGEEAKFIVRMLQAKLRIGIQIPTLLQALAYAFTLTQPGKPNGPAAATDRRKGQAKLSASDLEPQMIAMEAAVRQAFSEMPNFDKLISALMEGRDGGSLLEVCRISLGVPVKPMLAKPSKGIAEVGERLSGKRFTGEWKYDGERAQIHVLSKDTIQIYSRNSENMTEKYPDVIQVVKDSLAEDVQSCIIDSELVAFDQINKKILPFQVLTTRGRKNIAVEDIKVNVCLFAFDCMLINGQPLVKEPLEVRREKLWKILSPSEGKVTFAVYRNFNDINEEEIQAFLDESIAGSCEGLMLKTLTENATYEPSKRSLNWLKLKKDYLEGMADSIDVVPIGAYYGKGKRSGAYGAYLLAIYDEENEEFQTVCKAGTGFSDEDLVTHYGFFKNHQRPCAETNYNVNDKLKPDVWLEPCQVWEIRAADLSISPVHTSAFGVKADGKGIGLRFPRFLRIRDDKTPEESTGSEQIVEMFEAQASISGTAAVDDDF